MKCSTNQCRPNMLGEIDRGLNRVMRGVLLNDSASSDDPRLSVLEFPDRYVVECDVPGVARDAISVQIEDNVLAITGKRAPAAKEENTRVVLNERSTAEFARQIRLPRDVDQTSVDAELNHGVLKVSIPKRPEVLPQKINIKTA